MSPQANPDKHRPPWSPTATLLACCLSCGLALSQPATVTQPRPFGHTIGDILTQRVLLARGGRDFTPAALPAPGRTGTWLERRGARIEADPAGHRWLVVDYQIVNAPRALTTVTLPPWDVAGAAGTAPLRVPAATFSVAPITAPAAPGQPLALRPDRPPPAIATAPMQRRLVAWIVALATIFAGWLGWLAWTRWRARSTLPFARAWQQLRSRGAAPAAAHLALHHAFDRTAGRVLHAGTLATLFERAPYLQSLRPQIERFYDQSAGLFFGSGLPADAVSPQALCRSALRLQRRHRP